VGAWIFVAVVCGIPMLLTASACSRYFTLSRSVRADLGAIRLGMWLIVISTASWLFVFALMTLQDRSTQIRVLARAVAPGPIGLVNLLVCAGAIICSHLRGTEQAAAVKRAVTAAGVFLMLIWLFVLANPH
jgi:hypothetical protein